MTDTNDAPESKQNNIVGLPDNRYFWKCALCGTNIQESMKSEDCPDPSYITTQDGKTKKEKRMIFCGACTKGRITDINQYIAKQSIDAVQSELEGKVIPRFSVPGDKVWRMLESEKENAIGEKLKVISWQVKNYGIMAAVVFSGKIGDRLLCFNMNGMSVSDFELSLDCIMTQYIHDFGRFMDKEKSQKTIHNHSKLPIFRAYLLQMGSEFSVFYGDEVTLRVGFVETVLSQSEFIEMANVLTAAVAFFQVGTLTKLEKFRDSRLGMEDKVMNDVTIWSKKNPNVVISANISNSKKMTISKSKNGIGLEIGYLKLDLDSFDFIDISKIIDGCVEALKESLPTRRRKALIHARDDRYIRFSDTIPMTHKFIMRDLGWSYDFADFARASNAAQFF